MRSSATCITLKSYFAPRLNNPEDYHFSMVRVVDQCQSLILARCQQLIRTFDAEDGNVRAVLRLFYKMVVFDSEFDTALVEFLKQATGNYIRIHPEAKLDSGHSIKDSISDANKISVAKYLHDVVFKNEEDPDPIVFNVVALAMRIRLQLLEYPKQSEDNKKPYVPMGQALALSDALDMCGETVSLLRSSKTVYDVLYSLADIKADPVLLEYDKSIEAVPTSDGEKIIEPLCCSRGYYLPGYYNTMVKKQGRVTRTCVACEQALDEESYRKVLGMKKGWPYAAILSGVITVATYAMTVFFVIDHVLFY